MLVEHIFDGIVLVSTVIRNSPNLNEKVKTNFVTERSYSIQVGVLHRQAGTSVKAHQHLPTQKTVSGCQEVLIVKSGHIQVDIYALGGLQTFLQSLDIGPGDVYIQYCGGHAFHFQTDVQLIEIKQGPYTPTDKVFFVNPLAHEQTR